MRGNVMNFSDLLIEFGKVTKIKKVDRFKATLSCDNCSVVTYGLGDDEGDATHNCSQAAAYEGWKIDEETGDVICDECLENRSRT